MTQQSDPMAIVWDCDGTVVDSEPIGIAVWTEVLADFDCESTDADWELLVGRPYPAFYAHFAGRSALPPAHELMEVYLQRLYPALRSNLRAFADAVSAIDFIAAKNVPMAIASSSYRGRLDLMLEVVGLTDRFDVTVAGDEVVIGKPEPDIYEAAAAQLGVPVASCLAVEDSAPGVEAALAAGMRVVGVARSTRSAEELSSADVVVERLYGEQLHKLLLGDEERD
ncbi:MAG: HAD family phosphatase [Acidimicrobiia bacterium]|nr:HAD family phosphatase [Acidimicrobiia bacterium]